MQNMSIEILKLKNRMDNIERRITDKSPCDRLKATVDKWVDDADNTLADLHRNLTFTITDLQKESWLDGYKTFGERIKRIIE